MDQDDTHWRANIKTPVPYPPYFTAPTAGLYNTVLHVLSCGPEWGRGCFRIVGPPAAQQAIATVAEDIRLARYACGHHISRAAESQIR